VHWLVFYHSGAGDLEENRGYWKLKKEAVDRTLWTTRFGRGYEGVVTQNVQ